jgi:hypothetical protein
MPNLASQPSMTQNEAAGQSIEAALLVDPCSFQRSFCSS